MAISFGGLSTGLDTSSLIKSLMEIERQPITRLEADKKFFSGRLSAFTEFNTKLTSLLSKIEDLDTATDLQQKAASLSKDDFFSASATGAAYAGTYALKAHSLAQVEKLFSQQFADQDTTTYKTGILRLTVDGTTTEITIDSTNNTLTGIMGAINDADAGVAATIVNDGTANPYRLVLTADTVATTIPDYDGIDNILGNADDQPPSITLDTSELTGGSGVAFSPTFSVAQQAQLGHISVDTINIYNTTNTYADVIPGLTLTMSDADAGVTTTTLSINFDETALKNKVSSFVAAYNDVLSYITKQSTQGDDTAGILNNDSGLNAIKRRLQNLLTTQVQAGGTGSLTALSDLGLETQRDGTLKINDTTLTSAIRNNLDNLVAMLAGEDTDSTTTTGIAVQFKEYLEEITDTSDGFLAGRTKSSEANIKRIDTDIARIELRLEKRQETLSKQFNALEALVSLMNSQSDYLTKQMNVLNNLWSANQ